MNYNALERYMKTWAHYDREIYNQMYLLAESKDLLRTRGRDIGNLFYHNKAKEDDVRRLFELFKNFYGTVTDAKKSKRKKFKEYKTRTDNAFDFKGAEEYSKFMGNLDKVWSRLYSEFNPSDVGTLYNAVYSLSEEEQLEEIAQFLKDHDVTDTDSYIQQAMIDTTFEDVASWFS